MNPSLSFAKKMMLALTLAIFLGELIIMVVIKGLGEIVWWQETLMDSVLLCLLTAPAVFFFAFRPLTEQLTAKARIEQEIQQRNADLQRANTLLKESQKQYVDLFNHSPVGYMVLAENGDVREINLTGADLLGMVRSQAANRRFEEFLPQEEREHWQQHRQTILAEDGKKSYKLVMQRADESTFYGLLDCRREDGLGGTLIRITFTDITKENFSTYQV